MVAPHIVACPTAIPVIKAPPTMVAPPTVGPLIAALSTMAPPPDLRAQAQQLPGPTLQVVKVWLQSLFQIWFSTNRHLE